MFSMIMNPQLQDGSSNASIDFLNLFCLSSMKLKVYVEFHKMFFFLIFV